MNKALEYMLKNQKKVLNQAKKITKNAELAEDVVQDVLEYFIGKPDLIITYPAGYVWFALRSKSENHKNDWEYCMEFDKEIKGEKRFWSHFDKMEALDLFEHSENRLAAESLLEIADGICTAGEMQAILDVLDKDELKRGVNGSVTETTRTQRRNGILRLQKFLFNKTLGIPRHAISPEWGRQQKMLMRIKNENSTNT